MDLKDERYDAINVAMGVGIDKAHEEHPEYFRDGIKKAKVRLIIIFPEYRGKGLLTVVFKAIEEIARGKGFECIVMTATAPQTFHMGKKFNYTVLSEIKYEDIKGIEKSY